MRKMSKAQKTIVNLCLMANYTEGEYDVSDSSTKDLREAQRKYLWN